MEDYPMIYKSDEQKPLFELWHENQSWKLYENGDTEGFPPNTRIINRALTRLNQLRAMLKLATLEPTISQGLSEKIKERISHIKRYMFAYPSPLREGDLVMHEWPEGQWVRYEDMLSEMERLYVEENRTGKTIIKASS